MALWAKLQNLPGDALRQVQGIYGEAFPIEVRCALAHWIEDKPWNDLDPENPHHEQYAATLVATMIQEMENKMNSEENFLMRIKLHEAINYFRQNYSHNPMSLVQIVRNSLQTELKVIQHAENMCLRMSNQMHCLPDPHQEINQSLDKLRQKTQETEENLRQMQQEQESLVILIKKPIQYNQMNVQPDMQKGQQPMIDRQIQQRAAGLAHMRLHLSDRYQETFTELSTLQTKVLDDELIKWKRNQQLAGNGGTFENNLDQIQEWCEALAEIIWQNRQQIKRLEILCAQLPITLPPGGVDKLPTLNTQITSLLSSLVTSTFIIEKQPPQVMKTNTRFTATVRLLVGGKLNVHMTPPQVKATIISEAQANALLKNDKMAMGEVSGEILNNSGSMEYHQATRQLSVSFRNMQLRKIKRAEKKGTESVMDEKFSLLFQSQFKVGGGELVFQVWTLSLPVVVIVHGNQEPHAWATVTWDNAFAEPGRVPFAVPDKVSWPQMAEVLSTKFKSATGKGLNEENLRFLAGKAFRSNQLHDLNTMMVSWSQFCKEPLPDRNFTFWEWFYAIMKVTREHLRGLWNDSLILGFIGRRQAEEMLLNRCSGTFLLRYSDSELGGVTIAWTAEDQHQEGLEVFNLQPFTSRDFNIRSLADRINDLKHLQYLYPDIPKDQAFGKYYTPFNENQPQSNNGYVRPLLVAVVPGFTVPGSNIDSFPGTPHSLMHPPQSPEFSDASACATDQPMNAGAPIPEMDYDLINMEILTGDAEMAIDFSSINIADLLAYGKQK